MFKEQGTGKIKVKSMTNKVGKGKYGGMNCRRLLLY